MRMIFVFAIVAFGFAASTKGAFNILLFYLWQAYFRPADWVYSSLIMNLRLSLTVGALLVLAMFLGRERYKIGAKAWLLWAFCVHSLLGTVQSAHSDFAWEWLQDFMKIVLVTTIMVALINTPARLRAVIVVIALSLGFEVVKQGYADMATHPGAMNPNGIRSLGDNNGVAIGVLMLIPVLRALAQTSVSKWEKRFWMFWMFGSVYRAISTYSRGAFLAAGVLAVFMVARSKHKLRSALALVLVVLALLPLLPQEYWDRMNTIKADESGEREDSSAGRLHFWVVATQMAAEHPILGVGFNTYNHTYDQYDFLHGRFGTQRSVHSTWFGVLAEVGYLGLAIYLTVLATALLAARNATRLSRLAGRDPRVGVFSGALFEGLLVFIVGGTFLPFQYTEMLWHYFGLAYATERLARTHAVDDAAVVPHPAPSAAANAAAPQSRERPALIGIGHTR